MNTMNTMNTNTNTNTNNDEFIESNLKKIDNDMSEYDSNDKVLDRFKKIKTLFISLVREHESLLKIYKKNCDMEVKKMSGKKKKRTVDGEQKKSGFTKPTLIPKRVAEFLGLPEDSVIPRTNVTKQIYEYIKNNNLQDKEDKKKSISDEKLSKLFDVEIGNIIEFSTFQTLLSKVYNSEKLLLTETVDTTSHLNTNTNKNEHDDKEEEKEDEVKEVKEVKEKKKKTKETKEMKETKVTE